MRRFGLGLMAVVCAMSGLVPPAHAAAPYGQYTGAGAVVVKAGAPGTAATILDNGAVVCQLSSHQGIGGVCIPFADLDSQNDSIEVTDDQAGINTIFQVCIDNNGDGICGGGERSSADQCADRVVFSHASDGSNANPMRLPLDAATFFQSQCASNGGFPGFIVITCAGAHSSPEAHPHVATTGTVIPVANGEVPHGDFCGGPVAAKAYVVT